MQPATFTGIDLEPGPGVDIVWNAERLREKYESGSVDFVLSTECLEHVENWSQIVQNLKDVLKPGGYILITTRSKGFYYHAWPYDFWRYRV